MGENIEFGIKLSMNDPETKKVLESLDGGKAGSTKQPSVELVDDIDRVALEVNRDRSLRDREKRQRVSRQEREVEQWGRRAAVGAASDVAQRFAAGTNLQGEIAKGKVLLAGAAAIFLQRLLATVGQGLQASGLPGLSRLGKGLGGLAGGIANMVPGLMGGDDTMPPTGGPTAGGRRPDPWAAQPGQVFQNQLSSFLQEPGPPSVDGLDDRDLNRRPPADNMLA